MPTTYAHWRFGCECLETLPENLKRNVNDHRALFDIGVHGPDVFFYDLAHPQLPKYGSFVHHRPARDFFERAVRVYKEEESDKEAMMAYILGFLSHFAFDSQAHGYVDRKKELSGLSHNKIEAEYDGHLMRQDGRSVNQTDRSASLRPDEKCGRIIARFFPFNEKQMLRTCKMQHFIIHALNRRSNFKGRNLGRILTMVKLYDYADLIVNSEENKDCADSNLRLDKLKANALKIYPELVEEITAAIEGDHVLSAYFDHDFEAWPDYQNIPVLSLSEELQYTPELRK